MGECEWLKGSRLSKRWQGRIVQACVESSLLFDCQARVWYKRDVNKLQRWMDKCYRYVWNDRNGEPLRQMAERHENMTDVRQRLGIKSVEWKIERRVLERIGHVLRMENDRLAKAVVLGRWEGLEGRGRLKCEERGRLKCERCGRGFDAEGQRVSHVRSCTEGEYGGCKRWVSRANYAWHVRTCESVDVGGAGGGGMLGVESGGEGRHRMVTCAGVGGI